MEIFLPNEGNKSKRELQQGAEEGNETERIRIVIVLFCRVAAIFHELA